MNEELKDFMDDYEEYIEEYIHGEDEEDVIQAIYENEYNHKGCDSSDPRTIYDLTDISSLLEDAVNEYKKQEDRCSECARLINDEDYIAVSEDRGEFWGTSCSETVVTGYKCNNCGYEEEW